IDKEIKSAADKKIKEIIDKEIKSVVDKKIKTIIIEKIKEAADKEIEIIKEEKVSNEIDKVYFTESKELLIDGENTIFRNVLSEDINKSLSNKIESKRKIVSANSKYKEVISLSQSGLNETQIAKK